VNALDWAPGFAVAVLAIVVFLFVMLGIAAVIFAVSKFRSSQSKSEDENG